MIIVPQSVSVLDSNRKGAMLIEEAGRTCYKSEHRITNDSYITFINNIKNNKHDAMLESTWCSLKVICSRDISHQIVRHRHFSFAQESQHYIKYTDGVTFVIPNWVKQTLITSNIDYKLLFNNKYTSIDELARFCTTYAINIWFNQCLNAEVAYLNLIREHGKLKAQEARCVLPNCTKTELCIAGNGRSWLAFFENRCGTTNTTDMQEIAKLMSICISNQIKIV